MFKQIFHRQGLHIGVLIMLLAAYYYAGGIFAVCVGNLWGLSSIAWFWIAAVIPVLHQVWVWLCWRTELYGSFFSNRFGDAAFTIYSVIFAILGISRVIVVFLLAIANSETIPFDPIIMKLIAIILLIPAIWLFYSVKTYFGFKRALGIDHFDNSYRNKPFVRKGIFRLTPNGMYVFGFLLLWVPGFWFSSAAALIAAAFNHLYIWVHYYCTELPDIHHIYGRQNQSKEDAY